MCGGVPHVGIGPPDLGDEQVLVVRQDVCQGGRHCGAGDGIDRDVVGGVGRDVDVQVLLPDVPRRWRYVVDHQPRVVVYAPGL